MDDLFLPGLPANLIREAFASAPGNEIESGKFANPESSAALVANTFGLFLDRPGNLPVLPGTADCGWPAESIALEAIVRFPWVGGRHPCLDVLVETPTALIGIESKRYEPFRAKGVARMSDAYSRPVWGDHMEGYGRVRDGVRDGTSQFARLDAAQLAKHAFGLRTAVHSHVRSVGKRPVLFYLYAEPAQWPDGRNIPERDRVTHRSEVAVFSDFVAADEVEFVSCSYSSLLAQWMLNPNDSIKSHAAAVSKRYSPTGEKLSQTEEPSY